MRLINKFSKSFMIGILALGLCMPTMAQTELTLEHAIDMAYSYNKDKSINNKYIEAYTEGNKYNRDLFSTDYRTKVVTKELYEQDNKYIKGKMEYQATKLYMNYVLVQKQMAYAKSSIELGKKQLRALEIQLSKGMSSQLDYTNKETEIAANEAKIAEYEKTLANSAVEFKNLTSLDITKYTLQDEFNLRELSFKDVGTYIANSLHTYWECQEELVDITRDSVFDTDQLTVAQYEDNEAQVNEKEINLEEKKKNVETTLMSYYRELDPLKQEIASYDQKIDTNAKAVKAAEIKYNNGYISQLEYEEALLKEEEIELSKYADVLSYNLYIITLENPWVALS